MPNAQTSAATALRIDAAAHLHAVSEVCPLCEQPIPHDRAEQVAERLKAREREQSDAITSRLTERFEAQKVEALEAARLETEQMVATARGEAREAVEALFQGKISEAEHARTAAQNALQAKTDEAATAKAQADAALAAVQGELTQAKHDGEAALETLRAETARKEATIRADAVRDANAAAAARIDELVAQKTAADATGAALLAQLEEAQRNGAQALAQAKAESEQREAAARHEATVAASERVANAERAQTEAQTKAAAAESQINAMQLTHETELADRLQEQREALEAAQTTALNAQKSAAFEERQKLINQVSDLQRRLEQRTAEELGEGAEVDLFEELKAEFPNDRIQRVGRGQPGADILHTIVLNGRECGTIIYDSKNHAGWRDEFVSKLKSDQMAAKADHAILSTRKFPAATSQLHVRDGVMIANPRRVVTVAQIVRAHLIRIHALRMSREERAQKTGELYDFITSQQCADMFSRLDELAETLLSIDAKELKAHQKVWNERGIAIKASIRVQAELRNQIDSIIGTASALGGRE